MEDIRELSDDDVDAAWALSRQAFDLDADRRERFVGAFREDRHLGLFADGRLVGKLVTHDVGQWFAGRAVPVGGIAGVTVSPERRATGVTSRLLAVELARMRDRGEVVSSLYPATVAPYRRAGWEVAGSRVRRRVALRSLAGLPRPHRTTVVPADLDADLDRLAAVYGLAGPDRPGWLVRDDRWFRDRADGWAARDHAYAYLVQDAGGRDTGYLVYHHTAGRAGEFYGLQVDELVAVDRDATLTLWRLLASNRGVSEQVTYHGSPTEPLFLLLAEQDTTVEQDWRWMSRLVDLAGAVAARGWPRHVDVQVHLEVVDERAPWNAGRWVLTVRDGAGGVESGGDGTVRATIGALAPLYTGMVTARTLARIGLLTGGDRGALDALDVAFAAPPPWMIDFF